MKKKFRHWAIKNGLIQSRDLKETREVFTFPDATKKPDSNGFLWLNLNVRRIL